MSNKLPIIVTVAITATPLFVLAEGAKGTSDLKQGKNEGAESARETSALTQAEANVLRKLHHANTMEVEAGNLAKSRGDSKAVKDYGEELVRDHTKADAEVRRLAKVKKVPLSAPQVRDTAEEKQMSDEEARMNRLKTLKGADFDREFVNAMLSDHERDIAFVRDARERAYDAQLRTLLDKTLPVLEKHRDDAQKLTRKTTS